MNAAVAAVPPPRHRRHHRVLLETTTDNSQLPGQMQRSRPNILITGTPGTGKTTHAEMISSATGFTHINIGDIVKAHNLHSGFDEEFDTFLLDEDKVCDHLEEVMPDGGGLVIDHHSCDFFPQRWFDLVVVLQTDNTLLYDRLQKRGYSVKKIQENIQCEIFHVVVEEANECYDSHVVQVLPSNDLDEIEGNVDRIVEWAREFCVNAQRNVAENMSPVQ